MDERRDISYIANEEWEKYSSWDKDINKDEVIKAVSDFCKRSWNRIVKLDDDIKTRLMYMQEDRTPPDEYVQKVVRLGSEFVSDSPDAQYLRNWFANRRRFTKGKIAHYTERTIPTFLSQIVLEPMLGLAWVETERLWKGYGSGATTLKLKEMIWKNETDDKGNEWINKALKDGNENEAITHYLLANGMAVDTLSLMCYILDNYKATIPRDDKGIVTFPTRKIKDFGYQAFFSESPWRNLYHDVLTCKFNGEFEMVASLLDSADSHIHNLLFSKEDKHSVSLNIPEILAILVDAEIGGKEYFVVEGVYGTPFVQEEPKMELTSKEFALRNEYYDYVYDSIMQLAATTGRGVVINYCFSGHYPSQGSTDFVNYVYSDRGKSNMVHYTAIKDDQERIRFKLPEHVNHNKDGFDIMLNKIPCEAVDVYCSLRRFNSWFHFTKRHNK